jgi:superfamily I DNA/RNA helicase
LIEGKIKPQKNFLRDILDIFRTGDQTGDRPQNALPVGQYDFVECRGVAFLRAPDQFEINQHAYDDDDQVSLIAAIFKQLGLDEQVHAVPRGASRHQPRQEPQAIARGCVRAATDPQTERLAVGLREYEAKLRQANALDFDDLLLEAVRLLRHDAPTRERNQSPLRIPDDRRVSGHQSQPVRADAAA